MKPGETLAYRGYLIVAALSGRWFDPLFYIKKDGHHIGSAATLDKAKRTIDVLVD